MRNEKNNISNQMMLTKIVAACFFILLFIPENVNGQRDSLARKYMEAAENFSKNLNSDSAIVFFERAADAYQKIDSAESYINALNQIGKLLTRNDEYEKAKFHLNKALAAGLTLPDSNNLYLATTYISLGVVAAAEGNYSQSLSFHHKALTIRLLKLGENDPEVASSYGNIGNVYMRANEWDKSIEAHLKALAIREKLYGKNSVEVIQSYANLGNAYREKKDYETSLSYFEKALKNKMIQQGQGHKDLEKYYKNISEVHYLNNNPEQGDFYKKKSEVIDKP